jgi:hypothetical protein
MRPTAPRNLAALLTAALLLPGCVPADTPPQLVFTPGAPVMVTERTFSGDFFAVTIPAGWRTVTAPAENPTFVTFVSPDDAALIYLTLAADDEPPVLSTVASDAQTVIRDGSRVCRGMCRPLYAALVVESGQRDAYEPVFTELIASIR